MVRVHKAEATILILAWFILALILTLWNLQALSKVPPLSWKAVGLVFTYAILFTLSVLALLLLLAITLIRAESKNNIGWLHGEEGANNLCFRGFTGYRFLLADRVFRLTADTPADGIGTTVTGTT